MAFHGGKPYHEIGENPTFKMGLDVFLGKAGESISASD